MNKTTGGRPALLPLGRLGKMALAHFSWSSVFLFFSFYLFSPSPIYSQGWQTKPFFDNYDFAKDGHPTPDGGFIICGETGPNDDLHDGYLLKLDPFGNEQWRRLYGGLGFDAFDDMEPTPDGGYVLTGNTFSFATGGNSDAWLVKVDRFGNTEWSNVYGGADFEFARQVIQTSDGGFAMIGRAETLGGNIGILVIKTDSEGNQEWLNVYGGPDEDEGWSITENADNQLVAVASTKSFGQGERDIYVGIITLGGIFLDFQTFGAAEDELGTNVISTSDGGLLIGGATRSFGAGDYDVILYKTNADATSIEWQETYGGSFGEWGAYLLELPDGYAFSGSAQSFNNLQDGLYLVRTDFDGSLIWQRTYGGERKDIPHSLEMTEEGGFLIAGHSRNDTSGVIETSTSYLVRTNPNGIALSNCFEGKIFDDIDGDCLLDLGEDGFENWILTARKDDGTTFYGNTDVDGNYSILTDTGNYVLTLSPPNTYWEPCENALSFTHANVDDTIVWNFPLAKNFICAQMEVDLATTIVEPCESSTWQVKYSNQGTTLAEDAFVEITLDSFLTFETASLPIASQNGLTYRFNLGNIEPGDGGGFSLTASLDCEVEIGRTHCLDAHIFPDSICLPNDPTWDEASLEVEARCLGDSVEFKVKNTGSGDMNEALDIIIVEDQIIGLVIGVDLDAGDSLTHIHPAFGKTIRLETKQAPGHPGRSQPSITVEGCNETAPEISKGFHTMFPEDDADAFRSIDCRESSESLPAEEKLAFPKGVGTEHLIPPGTDIEYLIPFQNNGEDTVDNVVIRDTLSPLLDWATLRVGAGSHPYKMEMSNTGVIQFTFDDINLPDSVSNEAESRGFIKFRVSQLTGNQPDSLIENRSCVFFDFGAPVAKPQAFHTLDKPKIFSISDVSLCTGGLYDGVVILGDTTFLTQNELPLVDSFSLANIMALPVYEFHFVDSTCANDEYEWLGEVLTQPGIYDSILISTDGCDSTLSLALSHLDAPTTSILDTTCANVPYILGSQTLTETGIYQENFSALNGCDSMVTLNLEVTPLGEFPADTAVVIGGEFLGNIITSDTLVLDTIPYELGCDILVMWEVSIFNSTRDKFSQPDVHLFPNPAFNEINLLAKNFASPIEQIMVLNSSGQVVYLNSEIAFGSNKEFSKKIDITNWSKGLYQIIIFSEKGILTGRFVK